MLFVNKWDLLNPNGKSNAFSFLEGGGRGCPDFRTDDSGTKVVVVVDAASGGVLGRWKVGDGTVRSLKYAPAPSGEHGLRASTGWSEGRPVFLTTRYGNRVNGWVIPTRVNFPQG